MGDMSKYDEAMQAYAEQNQAAIDRTPELTAPQEQQARLSIQQAGADFNGAETNPIVMKVALMTGGNPVAMIDMLADLRITTGLPPDLTQQVMKQIEINDAKAKENENDYLKALAAAAAAAGMFAAWGAAGAEYAEGLSSSRQSTNDWQNKSISEMTAEQQTAYFKELSQLSVEAWLERSEEQQRMDFQNTQDKLNKITAAAVQAAADVNEETEKMLHDRCVAQGLSPEAMAERMEKDKKEYYDRAGAGSTLLGKKLEEYRKQNGGEPSPAEVNKLQKESYDEAIENAKANPHPDPLIQAQILKSLEATRKMLDGALTSAEVSVAKDEYDKGNKPGAGAVVIHAADVIAKNQEAEIKQLKLESKSERNLGAEKEDLGGKAGSLAANKPSEAPSVADDGFAPATQTVSQAPVEGSAAPRRSIDARPLVVAGMLKEEADLADDGFAIAKPAVATPKVAVTGMG